MYKIDQARLGELFAAIAEKKDLFLPVKKADQTDFALWTKEAEVDLDTLRTVKSPKDCFFPQSETLYNTSLEEGKLSIDAAALCDRDFVVFGMRACDVQAVKVLDNVFLADPVDTYYAARREHAVLVAGACHEPEETCFCKVFGIDAAAPAADVATWRVGEALYWKALTKKGEALSEVVKEHLTPAEESAVEEAQTQIRSIIDKLPYSHLKLDVFKETPMMELFDSDRWEEMYKPCLACGTCTFVCPTCQCYDIRDFKTKDGVQRYRCWDSCMYSDFTMMAHGNMRTSQMQRFRQRFMHKLVYYPDNYEGMFSCVGCGRCVSKCPAALNIVKVIKTMGGEG
ncbi:MAG: 4Fe-4S dicluster domain-containing protein [Lachnospiraceae bacterium]|nr:4Fe-4S dicluster domain-containing protein [Lachnospiraceae bacterium]